MKAKFGKGEKKKSDLINQLSQHIVWEIPTLKVFKAI